MNIYCEWEGDRLIIKSGERMVGYIDSGDEDPSLVMTDRSCNPSFTFNEIEYIMDNFWNMPKAVVNKALNPKDAAAIALGNLNQ